MRAAKKIEDGITKSGFNTIGILSHLTRIIKVIDISKVLVIDREFIDLAFEFGLILVRAFITCTEQRASYGK